MPLGKGPGTQPQKVLVGAHGIPRHSSDGALSRIPPTLVINHIEYTNTPIAHPTFGYQDTTDGMLGEERGPCQ
jgi:hypothetical protein